MGGGVGWRGFGFFAAASLLPPERAEAGVVVVFVRVGGRFLEAAATAAAAGRSFGCGGGLSGGGLVIGGTV